MSRHACIGGSSALYKNEVQCRDTRFNSSILPSIPFVHLKTFTGQFELQIQSGGHVICWKQTIHNKLAYFRLFVVFLAFFCLFLLFCYLSNSCACSNFSEGNNTSKILAAAGRCVPKMRMMMNQKFIVCHKIC